MKTTTRLFSLAALAALVLLAGAGSAQAKQVHQYFYSGTSFDTGANPVAIAFDTTDQKVLVVNSGTPEGAVHKYTPSGVPAPFADLGGESTFTPALKDPLAGSTSIAVDESANSGNFYLSSPFVSTLYGYTAGGSTLAGFPIKPAGGSVCKVAVAPDGHVWLALAEGYHEYSASGVPTGSVLAPGVKSSGGNFTTGCRIAFDSAGNFYVSKGREKLEKFSSNHTDLGLFAPGRPPSEVGSGNEQAPPLAVDRVANTLFTLSGTSFTNNNVTQYDLLGNPITTFGGADPGHSYAGLNGAFDIAVNPQNHDVYVLKGGKVDIFSRDPSAVTVPDTTTGSVSPISGTEATLHGTINAENVDTTDCHFEWGKDWAYGHSVPCLVAGTPTNVFTGSTDNQVTAHLTGLTRGQSYHFRLVASNAASSAKGLGRDATFSAADPPLIGDVLARHITSDSFRADASINPDGAATTFHVDIGTDTGYGRSVPVPDSAPDGLSDSGTILVSHTLGQEVSGLLPDTTYHYRIVATNASGTTEGIDHTFTTFAAPPDAADTCPNALARQQTGSVGLFDCRAYELVSAAYTGGYDVRSDLTPGKLPLASSPQAADTSLYSMTSGTIPGIAGNPTNRGVDPYLAVRGPEGWSTKYVGLPSDNPYASGPFASPLSGTDENLDTFAFGGSDICSPCFADGSTNVPLRKPDGSLVQGMAGSLGPSPANPAGTVKKPLSADGSHLVFGSKQQFEPAGNSSGTDVTIYDRNLKAGTTQVASTLPDGSTIEAGDEVAELDISKDGSRILIGDLVHEDSAGNKYWHLYMHVGNSPNSIDLTPGATHGVLYDGMTADGSMVYFTTVDPLAGDGDTSADIFRADVGASSATLTRVSTGNGGSVGNTDSCDPAGNSYNPQNWNVVPGGPTDCSVVAVGGSGGVASANGSIYFLSPENLDGNPHAVVGAPNLYLARPGSEPAFVASLESTDNEPLEIGPHEFKRSFGPFTNAAGAAIDRSDGSVYVLDIENQTYEHEGGYVQKYDSAGHLVTTFGTGGKVTGFYEEGNGGEFGNLLPTSVAVDNNPSSHSYRDLYVPSIGQGVVKKFSPAGTLLSEISLGGDFPTGVAVSADGHVYVSGAFGQAHVYDDEGHPTGSFSIPFFASVDIAADAAGNSYVAVGSEVLKYGPTGTPLGVFVAHAAYGVKVDTAENHVFVDEGNQVAEFETNGTPISTFGSGALSSSRGLGVDSGTVVASNPGEEKMTIFGPRKLLSKPGYDNPLVIDSVREAGTRHTGDLQVTPDGKVGAFTTTLQPTGFDSAGHYEVFSYRAPGGLLCISCSPTGAVPDSDASLAANGSSLTENGDIFFNTGEPLVLRDSNERQDAYEWSGGVQQLISTGTSSADSRLFSVSADGKNAFFFTRQQLVQEDQNGANVRLYTARENGGFPHGPPSFSCAASDECHGAGSKAAPPAAVGTTAGTPVQYQPPAKSCPKGKVRRRDRCVSKPHHRRHEHRKHHHRRANTKPGGGK